MEQRRDKKHMLGTCRILSHNTHGLLKLVPISLNQICLLNVGSHGIL